MSRFETLLVYRKLISTVFILGKKIKISFNNVAKLGKRCKKYFYFTENYQIMVKLQQRYEFQCGTQTQIHTLLHIQLYNQSYRDGVSTTTSVPVNISVLFGWLAGAANDKAARTALPYVHISYGEQYGFILARERERQRQLLAFYIFNLFI